MTAKQTYFSPTTPQQRKLLFETWEQGKNITKACIAAHVGRSTFYYWKPRFDKDGYAGLERYEKLGVPVGTGRVVAEIKDKVLELNQARKDWGKRRLADEMSKANNWVPLISPNGVRRILREANFWKPEEKQGKKKPSSQ